MRLKRNGLLLGVFLLVIASDSSAATFSSSSAFYSAISTATSETVQNFSTVANNTLVPNGTALQGLTYSFLNLPAGGAIETGGSSISGKSLIANLGTSTRAFYPNEGFTVTFPTAVNFFGIFVNTQIPDNSSLSYGSQTFVENATALDYSTFIFLGATSSAGFTSATFTGSINGSNDAFGIPEFFYGTLPAVAGATPEPETYALSIAGVLTLGLLRRLSSTRSSKGSRG